MRRAAEEALRLSEARQSFLVRLVDTLRPLGDPITIQAAAARVLGEHLGANQVHYGEVIKDTGEKLPVSRRQQGIVKQYR